MRIPIMKTTKGSSIFAVNLLGVTWAIPESSYSWFDGRPAGTDLFVIRKPHPDNEHDEWFVHLRREAA